MTEKKMMEWSLGSIIINHESIVRILVNGQWSVVSSQLVQSWLSESIMKHDGCEICA